MGADCNADEREFRYFSFHEAIYAIEKDINNELYNKDTKNKKYSPFGLINQGLCKKYKFLLNKNFDKDEARKSIFDYNDLIKDKIVINCKSSKYTFPSNFIFVNKEYLEVIHAYINEEYKKYLSTIYSTIIGGGCLIMKDVKDIKDDNPNRYIILYNEINEEMGNEIDFILNIKNKKERENAINFILKNNLIDYFTKIKYDYNNQQFNFYNHFNQEIGYIIRCCSIDKADVFRAKIDSKKDYDLKNKNPKIIPKNNHQNNAQNFPYNNMNNAQNFPINNMNNAQNFSNNNIMNNAQIFPDNNIINNAKNSSNNIFNNAQNSPISNSFKHAPLPNPSPSNNNASSSNAQKFKRIENFPTTINKSNYANNLIEPLLNAAISFLFSLEELKIFFGQNKNMDFNSFKTIIMTKVGQNINKMKTYEKIFSGLLTNLDPDKPANKDYYNQTEQYDEEKGKKKFVENYQKGNIIQKMFSIPKEEKIFCKTCNMNNFQFNYSHFILLKNSQMNKLYQILFDKETETKRGKHCNFCCGQITDLIFENKYLSLPEWLIVIVEPTQINNLKINSFLSIKDGNNNAVYFLSKFIEAERNSLYSINMRNIQFCNKIEGAKINGKEPLAEKKLAVLFYYLTYSKEINCVTHILVNTSAYFFLKKRF